MPGLDQIHILIVDDNRQMRFLVRSLLREFGFLRVSEANDAVEAFEILRVQNADLIITDHAMRPIDGIEFAKMIRTAADSPDPFVPIILMTSHSDRTRVRIARDAGVNTFLAKPVSAKSILHHVNVVIADRRPFVRSKTYFGPDRRVLQDRDYPGPFRRIADGRSDELDLDAIA
jgi:CheY-like chemotaxis protein